MWSCRVCCAQFGGTICGRPQGKTRPNLNPPTLCEAPGLRQRTKSRLHSPPDLPRGLTLCIDTLGQKLAVPCPSQAARWFSARPHQRSPSEATERLPIFAEPRRFAQKGLDGLHVAVVVVLPTNPEEEGIAPSIQRLEQDTNAFCQIWRICTQRESRFAMPGDVRSLPASKSACIPMEWTADNDLRAKTNTFKSGKLSSSRRLCGRHNCQKGASQKHAPTLVLESRPWQPATQLQI